MIASGLPCDLAIRPAGEEDGGFMEVLYRSTRDDLRLINAEQAVIDAIIGHQYQAQRSGYASMFPNASYSIVERLGDRIGRIVVDVGSAEVRLVDIALLPRARGHGYGAHLLRALQRAASELKAPLALSVDSANLRARRLYHSLGFLVEEAHPVIERMVWHPARG